LWAFSIVLYLIHGTTVFVEPMEVLVSERKNMLPTIDIGFLADGFYH
jgi:hypothetical protein